MQQQKQIIKRLEWSETKNKWLIENRNISFEKVKNAIEKGNILDDRQHPRLNHQRLLVVTINNYAYVTPYVESQKKIFLKTIYPSRKDTKQYLKNEKI